jgi:hypothetical protein
MNRRDFVGASVGASLLPALSQAGDSGKPQLLELRRYRLRFGPMEARFGDYLKGVLVPALNRAGVKPVGVFNVAVGSGAPTVHVLLPLPNPESLSELPARLAADPDYRRDAAAFRSLPATDPPYIRRDSSIMVAFGSVPTIQAPAGPQAAASRVFELRTYESHNEAAGLKKIEMFETGGEIPIFRRAGLTPVFFARDVIGTGLPSLTYMLVFEDLAAREKSWRAFVGDPEWTKLSTTPGFTDIVSNIHNVLLRPTDYSQI